MLPELDTAAIKAAAEAIVQSGSDRQTVLESLTTQSYREWAQYGIEQYLKSEIRKAQRNSQGRGGREQQHGEPLVSTSQRDYILQAVRETVPTLLEVTEGLLRSSFALPDGSRVSWGNATVEDHDAAIKMHENNVVGNAVAAGLHREAVDRIHAASVNTLGDL